MTQGQRTPDDVRIAFAAKYLQIGLARAAARAVGIPERTGADLARELDGDEEFTRLRTERRERALRLALDTSLGLIEHGAERAYGHDPLETEHGWSDIGSNYIKAVSDLTRSVEKLERMRLEREGTIQTPGTVNITVAPTPAAEERTKKDDAGSGS